MQHGMIKFHILKYRQPQKTKQFRDLYEILRTQTKPCEKPKMINTQKYIQLIRSTKVDDYYRRTLGVKNDIKKTR